MMMTDPRLLMQCTILPLAWWNLQWPTAILSCASYFWPPLQALAVALTAWIFTGESDLYAHRGAWAIGAFSLSLAMGTPTVPLACLSAYALPRSTRGAVSILVAAVLSWLVPGLSLDWLMWIVSIRAFDIVYDIPVHHEYDGSAAI